MVKQTYPPDFDAAWNALPRKPGDSKHAAFRAWGKRIKEGHDPEIIIRGAKAYHEQCERVGTGSEYYKMGQTFFGPGLWFLGDFGTTPKADSKPEPAAAGLLEFYATEPLV